MEKTFAIELYGCEKMHPQIPESTSAEPPPPSSSGLLPKLASATAPPPLPHAVTWAPMILSISPSALGFLRLAAQSVRSKPEFRIRQVQPDLGEGRGTEREQLG